MKKTFTKKFLLCLLLVTIFIALLQVVSLAKSEKLQMIKKGEEEYIIYVSNLLNEEFAFAFANKADELKENLVFQNSAKDSLENGNNIAYVDSTLYNSYFKDKENTYLWVKQGEEYKLEAEAVNLTDALSEDEIQSLNKITKTIEVKVGEKELPVETVDEVKVTHKLNTLVIQDSKLKNVKYQIFKSVEGTKVAELVDLANKLNQLEDKDMFTKLQTYSNFKKVYASVMPDENDSDWADVEENTILQPQNSKKDEQYVVCIKAENENDITIKDIQIMTCKDEYTPEYEKQKVVKKEVSKMPITGDSIVLFIIAGIIIILIAVISILKVKSGKKAKMHR